MDVQIQSSAQPLDDGHGSRTTVVDPVSPRAVAVEAEERTHVHAEHRACQHVIPRQEISKPVREAQHPLPHGHARQHLVDEAGGGFGHAPAAAARAEATALTGERHEPLERAVGASEARETVSQHPAGQEVSELLFHQPRQRGAVRVTPRRLEEGVEGLAATRYSAACSASRGR